MEFLSALHPKVVHFPIALLLVYVLFEILFFFFKKELFSIAANYLLVFGVLGSIAAVLTGNAASQSAELLFENEGIRIPLGLISDHQSYASITQWLFTVILFVRLFTTLKNKFKGWIQIIILVASLVGSYFIYQTGEHGGELVYKYGVGTEIIKTK
ncbi:MAG: DUF2231 domain-containing protein [Ignavibacteria bacterium]|nr:DUF2231 domain-containing protein [Ignavibacteria bacterium]